MKQIKLALSYNDVLLEPQFSAIKSRTLIDLTTKIAPDITLNLPLIAVNMDTVVGVDMAIAMDKLGAIAFVPRFDTPEIQAEKVATIKKAGARCVAAIGIRDDYLKRAELLLKAGATGITIDIAHAHTQTCLTAISRFKNAFPRVSMIAGTVATYLGAKALFQAGADSIRVGVGVGTICTTRIMAGSGVPQITALLEANRAKKLFKNKFILADGGAANSGDIVKALACGASAVLSGSLYAGTDEAPGEIIEVQGKLYKQYNGSTSATEKRRQLSKDQTGKGNHYVLHVEGVEAMVPYKGNVANVVAGLTAGIRSGLSYSGAKNIKEFWKKAQLVQITGAGYRESQAHDVLVTA